MADARANNAVRRVVVLSADAPVRAALAEAAPGVRCAAVQSAYEAAAELVAGGAAALVVDLRLMSPRHLRLLQIARQRGVELLAVGGIPASLTAEDLSGVRFVARADLRATLERILAGDSASPASAAIPSVLLPATSLPSAALRASEAEPAEPAGSAAMAGAGGGDEHDEEGEEGTYVSQGADNIAQGKAERLAPAKPAAEEARKSEGRPHRPIPGGVEKAASSAAQSLPGGQSPTPRSILTKEELAALLEDEA
jgi:hypothetical protein